MPKVTVLVTQRVTYQKEIDVDTEELKKLWDADGAPEVRQEEPAWPVLNGRIDHGPDAVEHGKMEWFDIISRAAQPELPVDRVETRPLGVMFTGEVF